MTLVSYILCSIKGCNIITIGEGRSFSIEIGVRAIV